MIGTKLASYEITRPLGKGGMGEVWLARDTKLDRDVAIKVLSETMVRDPERVLRFEREAKLLGSLNHSNIAHVYGFEESGGQRFLVLEFVEGETLADRLRRGPVPVDEALEIGEQIAAALEAAHEKGIIHRDLKPGNVMLKHEGQVKVLDFGLAKALADDPSGVSDANSPTITADHTKQGVVLETAAYMSPEQARGKRLDKRTDIWSFGVVLFECLTGRSLFGGETVSDSIGAILHKDPDWTSLPGDTPPTVHLLVRRCLTKDSSKRLRDIGDARIELENAIADPTSSALGLAGLALRAAESRRQWSVNGLTLVAALILIVGITSMLLV
ncbi:MAG: serine/threonine protein kinase [Planctomycetes bacterium]|nr:serine/threonine protein kinase [Planctomycetota bacterium]